MKKILFLITALLIALSVLTACNNGADKNDDTTGTPDGLAVLASGGGTAYSVIYAVDSSSGVISAANRLAKVLGQASGVTFSVKTDYIPRGTTPESNACEILIGVTNRTESIETYDSLCWYDYVSNVSGNRIVICGGCDESTITAVEKFAAVYTDIKNDGKLELVNEAVFSYRHDKYKLADLEIGGMCISDFRIVISSDSTKSEKAAAGALAAGFGKMCGVKPQIVTDKDTAPQKGEILFGKTTRNQKEQTGSSIAVEVSDGCLYIGYGTELSAVEAKDYFMDNYLDGSKKSLMSDICLNISVLSNPISDTSKADPFITYSDGYYYALFTSSDRVRLYRSETLESIGTSTDYKDVYMGGDDESIKEFIWAPEMYHIGDRWYIYASGAPDANTGKRLFCLVSKTDDPYGEYTFGGLLTMSGYSIDPTVLLWNGQYYISFARKNTLYSNRTEVVIAKLTTPTEIDTTTITTITYATEQWEKVSGAYNICEAPSFIQKDGKLFLVYSANGAIEPHYCLGMMSFRGGEILRATSWQKSKTPLLSSANGIYGVGHCSFFISPDNSEIWIAYHGKSSSENTYSNRLLYVSKVNFENGIPAIAPPVKNVKIQVPSGE